MLIRALDKFVKHQSKWVVFGGATPPPNNPDVGGGGTSPPPDPDDGFLVGTTIATATNTGPKLPESGMDIVGSIATPAVVTLTTPGQIYENKVVYGHIRVRASDIIIRNVIVRIPASTTQIWGIYCGTPGVRGIRLEHYTVEVASANRSYRISACVMGSGFTSYRGNLSGAIDGIFGVGVDKTANTQFEAVSNGDYIHDLHVDPSDPGQTDGSHGDGVVFGGNLDNAEVVGSTVHTNNTSAILITEDSGKYLKPWKIEKNRLRVANTSFGAIINVVKAMTSIAGSTIWKNEFPREYYSRALMFISDANLAVLNITATGANRNYFDDGTVDVVRVYNGTTQLTEYGSTTPIDEPDPGNAGQMDRSGYPDGTGRWSHLPPCVYPGTSNFVPKAEGGWPVVYWVPSGSTFQSPNGEYVVRGRVFDPGSSSGLAAALGNPVRVARIICPEKFIDTLSGINLINMWGAVIQGPHVYHTRWLGRTGIPVYRSQADVKAKVNAISPIRPGIWYYDDTARIDAMSGHPVSLQQAVKAQSWNAKGNKPDVTPLTFQAWEGFYSEGDWIPESFDFTRGTAGDQVLILNRCRVDRVSVYFRDNDADGNFNEKEPGGDAGHLFVGPQETYIREMTIAKCAYQGFMMQQQMSGGAPRVLDMKKVNIRAETDPYYNGHQGYLIWFSWWRSGTVGDLCTTTFEDVSVWHPNKTMEFLVERHEDYGVPNAEFGQVVKADVPDWVTPEMVGINFAAAQI